METYNFFIGWNNQTKKLEVDKIESILNHHHEGYTIYFAQGCWKGQKEKSCVVVVTDSKSNILKSLRELKRVLKQEAIGYQIAPRLEFFV